MLVCPCGFYGLSKAWGESLARLYWNRHGIETVNVHIGSCLPKPTEYRHLGQEPTQNAEDWAAGILAQKNPLDPVAQRYQDGCFASFDFTSAAQRDKRP